MPYTPKTWEDAPSTATPIVAAELNRMEAGIASGVTTAEAAVPRNEVGAAEGVASTDASGRVPLAQLPIVDISETAYQALATKDPAIFYFRFAS